jgi:hypothetical protein
MTVNENMSQIIQTEELTVRYGALEAIEHP